jgi:hypothetical protein
LWDGEVITINRFSRVVVFSRLLRKYREVSINWSEDVVFIGILARANIPILSQRCVQVGLCSLGTIMGRKHPSRRCADG